MTLCHSRRARTVGPRAMLAGLAAALGALAVLALPAPAVAQTGGLGASMDFSPTTIASGKPTLLRVRLKNQAVEATIAGIGYDVVFPAGMRFLGAVDTNQCSGTLTPSAGGYQFRGGGLGYNVNCSVDTVVTVDTDTKVTVTLDVGPITSRNGGNVKNVEATLTVLGGIPPKITSPPLPAQGLLGIDYTHQVTVTGTAPVVVTAEGLPPGLGYDDTTRRVSGKPTLAGTYTVTLRATNGVAPPDAQVSIVEIRNPPLRITTEPPLSSRPLQIGAPAAFQLEAAGGLKPYRWDIAAGSLPTGLSLDAEGRITGTPTVPGTWFFIARVRDVLNQVDTRTYELTAAKISTTVRLGLSPNPAVAGQPVTVSATVVPASGPPPGGTLDVWVAGPGTRCPGNFELVTNDPVTTNTRSAALVGGAAQLVFPDLSIGRFRVCVLYNGDATHDPSTLGPVDLFVIKGVLLPSPTVALDVPTRVATGATIDGRVLVDAAGASSRPGGTVRVRAGARDLGEIPIVDGAAAFSIAAPEAPGVLAVTASYAGDAAYSPAVSAPAYVVVAKAIAVEPVPAAGDAALAALAMLLALAGAARLRRRR
ncbi:MAG: Ig-like domain repeat protein [Burkholderiales bacterium]